MDLDAQQIAIAEHMGWINCRRQVMWECQLEDNRGGSMYGEWPSTGSRTKIPVYHDDLDAMRSAICTLPDDNSIHGLVVFCNILAQICGSHRACVNAKACERSEAFLKTIGKWVDSVI